MLPVRENKNKAHKIIGKFARTLDFCLVWLFCFVDGIRQTNHVPENKTSVLPTTHMAGGNDNDDDNKRSIFWIELSSPVMIIVVIIK